jgi:hypothetical protein
MDKHDLHHEFPEYEEEIHQHTLLEMLKNKK